MTAARILVVLAVVCGSAAGESARLLTLEQAEQLALQNHPGIAAASLNAQAATTQVTQVRSAFHPLVSASLTSAGANRDSDIAAGTLQTSGLASRAATGIALTQLITDFGRTSRLSDAARLRAAARESNVARTKAEVLREVQHAYYSVLAADSAVKVLKARQGMQEVTLRQVSALAANSMKSTLDVGFAEVSLSESELALYEAENASTASRARLLSAMGEEKDIAFKLADVLLAGPVGDDVEALIAEAMKNRPEVSMARLGETAAQRFAEAENKLRYPSVSLVGVLGAVPVHQKNLSSHYSAAGLNVTIPFLNGGLFAARRTEAELRAREAGEDAQALSVRVAAEVRVAWLEAKNAWRKLDVTARLSDQATKTLRLASSRYELGLSSILELTQAQVAQTSAQIAAVNAKYDYLTRLTSLSYATGAFR